MHTGTAHARNSAVDLLRGLSMLYIVGFWHLMTYTDAFPGYSNPVTKHLTVAILAIFVFVSGLCVAGSFERGGRDSRLFYRKRFIRIYPLFVLAAILFFVAHLTNPAALLRALFLLSPLVGKQPPTLWFVANLCLYYLMLPVLAQRSADFWRFWQLVLLIEVVLCVVPLFSGTDHRLAIYFPAFCLGVFFSSRKAPDVWPWFPVLLLVLGASVWYAADPEQSLVSIGFATVIPVVVYFPVARLFAQSPLPAVIRWFAYTGLAAYLLHRVCYRVLMLWLDTVEGPSRVVYLVVIGLPVIFGVAYLIQRAYDVLLVRLNAEARTRALREDPIQPG